MKLYDKKTKKYIGRKISLEEVKEVGKRFMFEGFLRNCNYLVYEIEGEYGIINPALVEVEQ